jgi:hypothetical protein
VGEAPALFVPLTMEAEMMPGRDELEKRRSVWLLVIARLKPGVSRESAEAAMNAVLEADSGGRSQGTAADTKQVAGTLRE